MSYKGNVKYVYLKDGMTWTPCEMLGQMREKNGDPLYLIVVRDNVLKVPVDVVRKIA